MPKDNVSPRASSPQNSEKGVAEKRIAPFGSSRPRQPSLSRMGRMLGGHLPAPGQRIGLFGGSFNPAHEGHLAISDEALRRLDLDEVWWLISPQNPLKSASGMAPQSVRAEAAAVLVRTPKIRVTMLETAFGTAYTAETLRLLIKRFPRVRFVWLMGADNLVQIDRWQDWHKIFNTMAIAVFDRPTYSLRALAAKAARRFARFRRRESDSKRLADRAPPAWVFLHNRLNAQSSTAMRAAQERASISVQGTGCALDEGKD